MQNAWAVPSSTRSQTAIDRVQPQLQLDLKPKAYGWGHPFTSNFQGKPTRTLGTRGKRFERFRTYPICAWSGELGPKLAEGDNQAPEGFYYVNARRLNPMSTFHLSFNLGFPNQYDRLRGRTGSYLMVHGNCVSIGCYAMTDPAIEEIWTLIDAAMNGGQNYFRVHAFPFRMTEEKLNAQKESQWYSFWSNLKQGYDLFETTGWPPNTTVHNRNYVFTSTAP